MEADRIKWNQRFSSQDTYLGERPSPFLSREIERIMRCAPGRRALDIACGEGRNSVFLAQQGFLVTALDISDVGLAKAAVRAASAGVEVDFRQADLDGYHITGKYDLIINFNFLLRDLILEEVRALAPGGLLIIDTIMHPPEAIVGHNPAYLLQQNELQNIFKVIEGEILFLEETTVGDMPTARILFRKPL